MRRIGKLAVGVLLVLCLGTSNVWAADKIIKMSTTTSTQASGLLDVLLPELEKDAGIKVKVIAKGTGAALRDGMDGNVDVILVHARERELKFVEQGYGTKRYAVMHNDFIIIGPPADPAGLKGSSDAIAAFKKLAATRSRFVSRGDDSGTHTKEQSIWKKTGLTMETKTTLIEKKGKKRELTFIHPHGLGNWYWSIGQGMGKTLTLADEKQAYTMTDRGTYIKYKFGREVPIELDILCQGDPVLANPYGVIPIDPQMHPHVKYELAKEFAEWLVSERAQTVIANYRLLGKQLFYPDANR